MIRILMALRAVLMYLLSIEEIPAMQFPVFNLSYITGTWSFSIEGLGWGYWGTDFRWEYSSEGIDWGYKNASRFELLLSPKKNLKPGGPHDDEYDYSDDDRSKREGILSSFPRNLVKYR
jgi:hypothetical protein